MSTVKRVTVLEPISSQVVYDNTTEAPKLKVAAYARVSTEQDEQHSSYEAQVNYYNQYVRNKPAWEFVGIYADEGITGTNIKKRDGFNRMIADAKAGKLTFKCMRGHLYLRLPTGYFFLNLLKDSFRDNGFMTFFYKVFSSFSVIDNTFLCTKVF